MVIIAPTPRIVDGQLEVAFIVVSQQGTLLNGTEVYEAVVENEEQLVEAVSELLKNVISLMFATLIIINNMHVI